MLFTRYLPLWFHNKYLLNELSVAVVCKLSEKGPIVNILGFDAIYLSHLFSSAIVACFHNMKTYMVMTVS